jgi:hypothetical protein
MKRFCSLLNAIIFLFSGCAMTVSSTSGIASKNDWPKKKVMIMPVADLPGIAPHESRDAISGGLTEILQKTEYFNIYYHPNPKNFRPVRPNEPIDPRLLQEAQKRGINAIIFETLNPIELNSGRSVIWPFRKKVWECIVSMNIDIIDVMTETMLLSREIVDNTTLPGEEIMERAKMDSLMDMKKTALRECLPGILKEAANAAVSALNQHVWTGQIGSINTKEIIINAGSDADLRKGVVLEVWSKGEYITSFNKKTYQLSGRKVGEIQIISLKSSYALAQPINGHGFKAGLIVRVKD